MKVTIIMVSSADGVIAKGSDENVLAWTSKEDTKNFVKLSKEIGTLLVGGNTFKASGRRSYPGRIVYLLTDQPDQFDYDPETVIPINGKPEEIYQKLKEQGIEHVALTGGAYTNGSFLSAGLVDDMFLTIEPILLGKGLRLSEGFDFDIEMSLLESIPLNDNGTTLMHYKINNGSV